MKRAKWLCAVLLAVCLTIGMGTLATASAEGALAVGTLTAQNGASLNGSPNGGNVTVVTCAGGTSPHCYVQIDNYNKETITLKTTASSDAWTVLTLQQALAPWGELKAVGGTVTSAETTITIQASDIAAEITNETCNLFICWQGLNGTAEITELTVGDVSYTAPQYVAPVDPTDSVFTEYTQWTAKSDNVTIAANDVAKPQQDGVDEGIATITFSDVAGSSYTDPYTEESATLTYFAIPFEQGAVAASWAKLYMKYKATSGIASIELYLNGVVIADNEGSAAKAEGKEMFMCADLGGNAWNSTVYGSHDGYWLSESAFGENSLAKTALYFRIIFKDDAVAANEKIELGGIAFGTKRPVFATDSAQTIAAVGRQTNAAARFTLTKDGADTLISQIEGGPADQYAPVLVSGYTAGDDSRFMKIAISADKDFVMGVYYGWGTVVSPYTNYKANVEYEVYADLKTVTESNFEIWLFLDADKGDNTAKTYTVKSITFTDKAVESVPADDALTVNFTAETVGYNDEVIEVFADDQGQTAVANGATVTPGAKLYMRTKAREDDAYLASKLVAFDVPARPVVEEITPNVSDTAITATKEGYRFKLGADGAWADTAAFTGLTAGTEYKIYVQKKATATSFASEVKELTVKTTGTAPAGNKDGKKKSGCGSAMGGNTSYVLLAVLLATIACGGMAFAKKRGKE